jgi:hypothetical protein
MLLFSTGWKLVKNSLFQPLIYWEKFPQIPSVRRWGFGKPVWHSGENSLAVARTWHQACLLRLDGLYTFTGPEFNTKDPGMTGHSKYCFRTAVALFKFKRHINMKCFATVLCTKNFSIRLRMQVLSARMAATMRIFYFIRSLKYNEAPSTTWQRM